MLEGSCGLHESKDGEPGQPPSFFFWWLDRRLQFRANLLQRRKPRMARMHTNEESFSLLVSIRAIRGFFSASFNEK
jgi:hypothetical protein